MDNSLILTLDFGTQSARASLINKKGEIVAIVKKPYNPVYFSPQKGYAEQDADFYWRCAIDVLKELADQNKDKLANIIGSTITTFRDSSVQLDENYKPIRPVILWLDQRMAEAKEPLPFIHRFLFRLVGMTPTIELNRKRTVAHWLKENEPETWKKTKKYVNISTYLVYKLTGNLVDCPSSMTGHYPIWYKAKKWYKEGAMKGRIFGIPNSMLPELKNPGECFGTINDEIADLCGLPHGIKLIATGSDKGCEIVGLGALSNEIGAISYGTASSIDVCNKKYYEPETFLPAYGAAVPDWYNMEVQIYRGYWMLKWFSSEFAGELIDEAKIQKMAVEEILNKNLELIPPGSDGLVLQPYWGPGLARPLAKGSIVGFSDIHTRNHLYKAIIEGIAYALREGLESIEKHQRHKIKELRVSGGGSASTAICQITADIFGLPVSKIQTHESTSLGAAIATFYALGEFDNLDDATASMSHVTQTFNPNPENHAIYNKLYKNVYTMMYPQLKGISKFLNKFSKRLK